MTRVFSSITLLLLGIATPGLTAANAPVRVSVERFVLLPSDIRHPEGLAVDPSTGEVYVGTFDARLPESTRKNSLLRFSSTGALLAQRSFGSTPLTGVAFADGKVYVLNFGAGKLQRISARFDESTPIEEIATFVALDPPTPPSRRIENPDGSHDVIAFGASGMPGINGMVFDRAGNLYVSDSFQGAIYRVEAATRCSACKVSLIARDALLATAGSLPFGANGLALNADEGVLYVNNAGDGRVLRMPLPKGPITILAESVHGADGLIFHDGLLWVASNQSDTVVALDEFGRVRVRAGEFEGVDADGAPRGLLFPASTAVLGDWMIVTNLALPLTALKGDEWEEDVRLWTLARFRISSSSGKQISGPTDPTP